MRVLTGLFSIVLLLAVSGVSQTPCKAYNDAAGRYSFCPPEGWRLLLVAPDDPSKTWMTPVGIFPGGLLRIRVEATTLSQNDFIVSWIRKELQREGLTTDAKNNIKLVDWSAYKNENGVLGHKLVFDQTIQGSTHQIIQVTAPAKDRVIVIEYTEFKDRKADEAKLEAIMKTLKMF